MFATGARCRRHDGPAAGFGSLRFTDPQALVRIRLRDLL
jgi:hypothetical protein